MHTDPWQRLADGSLCASDGTVYRRTPERVTRRSGRAAVDADADVVTDLWPEGLVWHSGAAAITAWRGIAPRLATGRRRQEDVPESVGHIWKSDGGAVLLHFEGEGCP